MLHYIHRSNITAAKYKQQMLQYVSLYSSQHTTRTSLQNKGNYTHISSRLRLHSKLAIYIYIYINTKIIIYTSLHIYTIGAVHFVIMQHLCTNFSREAFELHRQDSSSQSIKRKPTIIGIEPSYIILTQVGLHTSAYTYTRKTSL